MKEFIGNLILKVLSEHCSSNSGIMFWMSVEILDNKILDELEKYPDINTNIKSIKNENGIRTGFWDNDPKNKNRLIITCYDIHQVYNFLDGKIKQKSSKERHYHNIILELDGKTFIANGGFTQKPPIKIGFKQTA